MRPHGVANLAGRSGPFSASVGSFAAVVVTVLVVALTMAGYASAASSPLARSVHLVGNRIGVPATLASPSAAVGGVFGSSVAISGTTVVVGAPEENGSGVLEAGHAYAISTKTGLVTELTSPNAETDGFFGFSVAVSGSTVVVGAPDETASGQSAAGHAYIVSLKSGLVTVLTSPNVDAYGEFGSSVAISGTTVVVGAPYETASGFSSAGHAYVFRASTGALVSTLTSPNAQANGRFGISVAVSGPTVVVGAPFETVAGQTLAGHAYALKARSGALVSTLTSPNAQPDGRFGASVAISGSTAVIGAPDESASGEDSAGNAYAFKVRTGDLISTFTSPSAETNGEFGYSVAIGGTTVLVGAPFETASGQSDAGNAYTFTASTGALIMSFASPNAQLAGRFGFAVAVGGSIDVAGAPLETVSGLSDAGHAYLV